MVGTDGMLLMRVVKAVLQSVVLCVGSLLHYKV